MKKLSTFTKLFATAAMVFAFGANSYAQHSDANLGATCGCPAISARTTVDFSTLPFTTARGINEFTTNIHLTCDKKWTFTNKWYVPAGITLTIDPGTATFGVFSADPTQSSCIIIERGGKLIADGTPDCNIVMTTSNDPMDGTYSVTNVSQWGGLVICGIAPNSLVSPTNDGGLGIPGHSGMGFCEGFTASNSGNLFGANATDPSTPAFTVADPNDNSGILRYLSVRHPGALVGGSSAGSEINGISWYSVGAGTTVDHVEVIASGDDDNEFFGGTVNIKHMSTYFGDDDKYDFDLGYSGKGQYYFSIAADSLNSGSGFNSSDNGFECDADDQFAATAGSNHSYPQFYNCTMISNGHVHPVGDNTGSAAIQAKECTGGHWYNCLFANFRSGLHLAEARSTALHKGDAYDQWTNDGTDPWLVANGGIAQQNVLTVKNCIFITPNDGKHYGFTRGTLVAKNSGDSYIKNPPTMVTPGIPTAADSVQFYGDGNLTPTSVPGIDFNWSLNAGNTAFANPFHVVPSASAPNIMSNIIPPSDGFFDRVSFKGAFDPNVQGASWLSNYGLMTIQSMAQFNPTDINQDGVTDITDFGIFVGKFGQLDK